MLDTDQHSSFLAWVQQSHTQAVAEECKRRLERSPDESPHAILHEVLDEACPAPPKKAGVFGNFRFNS
jgi:hypothetical protein